MTTFTTIPAQVEELLALRDGTLSRRDFIRGSGLLVVSIGAAALAGPFAADASAQAAGPYPDPDFRQLDSWIVIDEQTPRPSTSARPTAVRAQAPPSGR